MAAAEGGRMKPREAIRGTQLILVADPSPDLAAYVEAAKELRSFPRL